MRLSARIGRRLGLGLLVALILFAVARTWVVPRLIVAGIEARYRGRVTIRDWWLNTRSAGVVGLTLHEGHEAGSPAWATAGRVSTDLSLGGLLRGRVTPRRLVLQSPHLTLRIDKDNRLLTQIPFASDGSTRHGVPVVEIRDAEATVQQEDRPTMVVKRIEGRLAPESSGERLTLRTDDPAWGSFEALGQFAPGFQGGEVKLWSVASVMTDPDKVARIPFIPRETWKQLVPNGPADVRMSVGFTPEPGRLPDVKVLIQLRQTTVRSTTLDMTATKTTGDVVIEGGKVRLEHVEGSAIRGTVGVHGTLDFTKKDSVFDLALRLKRIDVADVPLSWQLHEAGITGLLTGTANLHVLLTPAGADLSGSTGEAIVEGGAIQGIPVKSLRLVMHAEGDDLQFDSKSPSEKTGQSPPPLPPGEGARRAGEGLRLRVRNRPRPILPPTKSDIPWPRRLQGPAALLPLIALQPPPAPARAAPSTETPEKRKSRVKLPDTISTQLELEDVDLGQLVVRAQNMIGFPFPFPITGRLDLQADATFPLGALRDFQKYAFHGHLTLRKASIYKVDLGHVSSRIDLANGVLDLKDFVGRLDDRPDGGPNNPPPNLPAPTAGGPLTPGGFRGEVHAELAPPGKFSARFEGNGLPLAEIGAPFLPRPTPVSGLISLNVQVQTDLKAMAEPRSWVATGEAESVRASFRDAALDRVALKFGLKGGRLDVTELTAQLAGRPLAARGGMDLAAPYAFRADLDATGWDLAKARAWLPDSMTIPPTAGLLTARAGGEGTLSPLRVQTRGEGRVDGFQVGRVPLGVVPFRWSNHEDVIRVEIVEARSFGGTLTAEADVPLTGGKSVQGSAAAVGIDTAMLSSALPGGELKLAGKADGRVRFLVPADAGSITSSVQLTSTGLTVQGIPAEKVTAAVSVENGQLSYDVTAESLGGKIKFQGKVPLNAAPPAEANGVFRAVGFTLARLWKAAGMKGIASRLEGLGAINANVRIGRGDAAGLWVRGVAELRDLRWGKLFPIGHLRGTVAMTPDAWWVDPIGGEALGGSVSGSLRARTPTAGPPQMGITLKIDRAILARVVAFLPSVAPQIDGFGTFQLSGTLADVFHANIDVAVSQARLAGLTMSELRAPAVLVVAPGSGTGSLRIPRLSARIAGGEVRGDLLFRLGDDQSFHANLQLASVELETLTRIGSESRQPASGRISGRVMLTGPNPADPERYRGRVNLDLTDASLVQVPVFRELDRFLGSASGGIFEDGDLIGVVAHRSLTVESLTLAGRLAQVHGTGKISFDGKLDLEMLVNTNQLIPQTGQALVAVIPGLREVVGLRRMAMARVANFLGSRLLKLHVTGTVRNPSVAIDSTISVPETAVGFFGGVLKLPLDLLK